MKKNNKKDNTNEIKNETKNNVTKLSLDCHIVKDLLPTYIEKLTSKETNDAIDNHLKSCEPCRMMLSDMMVDNVSFYEGKDDKKMNNKKNETNDVNDINNKDNIALEKVFKKINSKLSKKVKTVTKIFLATCLAIFILFELLYNLPLKTVKVEDVHVRADNYLLEELKQEALNNKLKNNVNVSNKNDDEDEVVISVDEKGEKEEELFELALTNDNTYKISLSDKSIKRIKDATAVYVASPYIIRKANCEIEDGVLTYKNFKTTILNNKASGNKNETLSLHMLKIDKVVYEKPDKSQIIMWQSEE